MNTLRLSLALSLAFVLASAPTTPVGAQGQATSAAAFFDDTVLQEVRLLVNSRDMRELRERYLDSFTVPADLIWRNTRVRNVGIRLRGAGSRNPVKLGFDVSFDRYTTGQQFLGLTNLVLDNLWQDPSLLREALSMSVFRRMGQVAPRESFGRLYINNEFQGVYGLTETIDPRFAAAAMSEANGRLFEFRYVMPYFGQYLGPDLAPYKQLFASRTTTTDTDSMLYGPIEQLLRVANDTEDVFWRERVDAFLDLPQLISHAAIQGCLSNIDGFMGYAGLNNFYLYRFAASTRHRLFPWDEDFAFIALDSSILRRGDEPVPFFDRALVEPDLRALFLDTAETCARRLEEDAWLANEIERVVGLVGPSILADPRKQFSNEIFAEEVEFLRRFASERPAVVLAEIAALR